MLAVTAADGATVTLEIQRSSDETAPVLLFLPAMGVEARHYRAFAAALRERGLHAAHVDQRGMGTSSVRAARGVDYGYTTLVADLDAAVGALQHELPGRPLFLGGHSLGGHLAALWAATRTGRVAGVPLVASGTPYFGGFPGAAAAGLLLYSLFVRATTGVLGYFPGDKLGFGGRQGHGLMCEWAAVVRGGSFAPAAWPHGDAEAGLAAMRLPVLGVRLEGDGYAPQGAVEHLLGKLRSADVDRELVRRSPEHPEATDHIRWLRHPAAAADVVAPWVHRRASGAA